MSDPTSTIIDSENLLGQTISERYEVRALLGEGSMGVVFLAEHTHMKKKVALKVMRAEFLANPEAVERFQREAQATGHIEHPHVCAATDFGRLDDERFFLVMEYLDGKTLGDVLDAEGRLSPERAVKITRQIAQGLQRAHELEVVHRDLKPDNVILVEREGDTEFVKITDFGVARVEVVDAQNLTKAGTTMGTPVYMSPEQAVAKRADERSDLYTLGVMLFEMLTGEVPFYSESLAVILSKHATEPPPPMHEVAPDAMIPEDLCEIVEKLLHKKPEQRFQSAVELIGALESADLSPWVPGLAGAASSEGVAELVSDIVSEPADDAPKKQLKIPKPPGVPSGSEPDEPAAEVSGSDVFGSGEADVAPTFADEKLPLPARERPSTMAQFMAAPAAVRYGIAFVVLMALAIPVVAGGIMLIAASSDEAPSGESGMAFTEDEVAPPDLESERKDFLDDVDLEEKLPTLAPDAAIAALQPMLAEHGNNAHLQFLLAKAHVDAGKPAEAMPHYEAALKADARYAQDSRLLSDVRRLFADKSDDVAAPATPLMLGLLQSPAAGQAEAALVEIGIDGSWNTRKRARDVLKEANRWEALAEWQRHAIDLGLVGRGGCDRALKHIKELEKIGDPAALGALQKATRRPKEGCGFLKKQDCYKCMRGELGSAIKTLKAAEKEAPTAAAAEPDAGE